MGDPGLKISNFTVIKWRFHIKQVQGTHFENGFGKENNSFLQIPVLSGKPLFQDIPLLLQPEQVLHPPKMNTNSSV